jgi:hypothetical protein
VFYGNTIAPPSNGRNIAAVTLDRFSMNNTGDHRALWKAHVQFGSVGKQKVAWQPPLAVIDRSGVEIYRTEATVERIGRISCLFATTAEFVSDN